MNVLIVDDDAAMANLIGATLRSLAGRIEVADSFVTAKAWITKVVFQIILLDLKLPDSTPNDTLIRIKELTVTGAQVVIITGAWPPNVPLNYVESGAMAVIYKGDMDMNDRLRALVAH